MANNNSINNNSGTANALSLAKDSSSRDKIVNNINTSFFVEAGAGSGKTTMLVNRLVAMIEAGIEPSKICAITFTKAAANEFYARFQKLLAERSTPTALTNWQSKGYPGELPKPTPQSIKLCEEALKNIDQCFMGTIDAFCQMVISEHPFEAQLSSSCTLISTEAKAAMYTNFLFAARKGTYGKQLQTMAKCFGSLFYDEKSVFTKGVDFLLDNRHAVFAQGLSFMPKASISLATEITKLESFITDLETLQPNFAYEKEQNSCAAWASLPKIKSFLNSNWDYDLPTLKGYIKALFSIRLEYDALRDPSFTLQNYFVAHVTSKAQWLEISKLNPLRELLDKLEAYTYTQSLCFFAEAVKQLAQLNKDSSQLSYFDYLFYLRELLTQDAKLGGKLIKYIANRHSYFLIDEFQDTNPLQAEIFFYLAAQQPVADWKQCVPRPGALFIVGDPKQSIYRFRGADVTAFARVKGLFTGSVGQVLELTCNFRSTDELCLYFNVIFSRLMPKATKYQSQFEQIPLIKGKTTDFTGVYLHSGLCRDEEIVCELIEELVDNPKYLIKGAGEKVARRISYKDIMVIGYTKFGFPKLINAIQEHNIPLWVEGSVPFDSNAALKELLKLYKVMVPGATETEIYGALKGNLLALTEEEIYSYTVAGGNLKLNKILDNQNITDSKVLKVIAQLTLLRQLQLQSKGMTPAAVFNLLMEQRCFEKLSADNLEVLYYTLELLRAAEKDGAVVSLAEGLKFLEQVKAKATDHERCLSLLDNLNRVHLANLHKVKGLEAPIVILAPHVTDKEKPIEDGVSYMGAQAEGYIYNLTQKNNYGKSIPVMSSSYLHNATYDSNEREEKENLASEKLRLLYVAATRARNALFICESSIPYKSNREEPWLELFLQGLPSFSVTGAGGQSLQTPIDPAPLYDKAEADCVLKNRTLSEKNSFAVKNPSRERTGSKLQGASTNGNAAGGSGATAGTTQGTAWLQNYHDLWGTMVHKLMELLVSSKNQITIAGAVKEILGEYLPEEAQALKANFETALKKLGETMQKGGYPQANGVPQDILNEVLTADEVYCEVPFSYTEQAQGETQLWSGTIDLIYCKNGAWHIVDYKTNQDGTDLDTKYKPQLDAYCAAFKEITGLTADAKIYHIAE